MYVCMFFKDISRSRALSESKVASCYSPVNSTLHRHGIIRVRFLTSAHHVKKYCFLEGAFKKMHVNFSSSSENRRVRKTGVTEKHLQNKYPCLRLNHVMPAITCMNASMA